MIKYLAIRTTKDGKETVEEYGSQHDFVVKDAIKYMREGKFHFAKGDVKIDIFTRLSPDGGFVLIATGVNPNV